MSKKQLPITPKTADLIERWKTARDAERGWNTVRKEAEAALIEENEDFQNLFDTIDPASLTTSAVLGDLEVTVGNDLKADQAQAIQFLSTYPSMVNVMFKLEYKPVARAVLPIMAQGNEMGEALKAVLTLKKKSTGFKLK